LKFNSIMSGALFLKLHSLEIWERGIYGI